ncbi:MAG TPA: acylphosphatase [Phycisphaerae bacterium]|nr:acylphosphatase [Phycisphaerae bacterium]
MIVFSGRVQGVGFRMTAVALSRGLAVAGTVRNLPDGRVELVVQGSSGEIESLVGRLREHFGGFIRRVDESPAAACEAAGDGIEIVR